MQVICHSRHAIGEFGRIRNKRIIVGGIAASRPTIVQNDIVVAEILEPIIDNQLRGLEEESLGNFAAEGIPVILYSVIQWPHLNREG